MRELGNCETCSRNTKSQSPCQHFCQRGLQSIFSRIRRTLPDRRGLSVCGNIELFEGNVNRRRKEVPSWPPTYKRWHGHNGNDLIRYCEIESAYGPEVGSDNNAISFVSARPRGEGETYA